MTDLTDKWKKGELPVGEYYLLYKDGTTDREYYDWANVYGRVVEKGFSTDTNDIEQVLAEVPTFEQWQASEKYNKHLEEVIKIYERKDKQATETSIAYNELLEENTKLRELLKEWVQFEIEENPLDFTVMSERMSGLANKTKRILK